VPSGESRFDIGPSKEVFALNDRRMVLPLSLAVLILAGVISGFSAAAPRHRAKPKPGTLLAREAPRVNARLTRRLRAATWRWQVVMGRHRSRLRAPLDTRKALRFWRLEARRARWLAAHPPHRRGWLCIHHYEGSWGDSGDPYWGGLQMDRGFMRAYAPRMLLRRGWANRWSPLEQMWVAEHAHRGRGYSPWPNTARFCGLS
jgi:hypothetical protein